MAIKLSISKLPDVLADLNESHFCRRNKFVFDLSDDSKSLICLYDKKIKLDAHNFLALLNEIITSHNCSSFISINIVLGDVLNSIQVSFSL